MLIDHIDKIAREKKRDVIYIAFQEDPFSDPDEFDPAEDYPASEVRENLLHWFKDNGITVMPCRPFAVEGDMESYQGQLYIDVPFDRQDPDYVKLEKYLADKSGSMKLPGVKFFYLTLEEAMKNAHHDEPGYWEEIDL
ncbi:MAG TPA: hypothetical protein PLF22_09165 [Pseudomonadales bacterium]|nr:hypothetical protein [Pseudomonadales bacterium]